MRVANASCSWGVLEFEKDAVTAPYNQALDEIAELPRVGRVQQPHARERPVTRATVPADTLALPRISTTVNPGGHRQGVRAILRALE